MRLAKSLFLTVLTILALCLSASAQTPRSTEDNRNIAPTVGTGGPVGGPTGLFTVYDGQTLRAGEFTFSAAYSNFDRDPGNVDITEIPVSFQVGLNDYVELFFNTDAWRGVKVNSPRNLSGFSLPNSTVLINGVRTSAPAIVLSPATSGAFNGVAVFRPQGSQPFVQFPFVGGLLGNFGFRTGTFSGPFFGFPAGTFATGGARTPGDGGSASQFPGIGSPVGGILPGIVLSTSPVATGTGAFPFTAPTVFTIAPSYLPDAPFVNRTWGQSAFSTFSVGAKIRLTGPNNPVGLGIIPFYRYYGDTANRGGGFNMLQRGASPGGNRGDFGLVGFGDARLTNYLTLSGNVGYIYNSNPKVDIGGTDFTLLDRGDELMGAIGVDVVANRYFQLIGEARGTKYVGGRTPNAFEQDPIDLLGGVRIFPTRYFGMSFAYRYNVNQQDQGAVEDAFRSTSTVSIPGVSTTGSLTTSGVPTGFTTSDDPHGFIFQIFAGRRNARVAPGVPNRYPTINSVDLGRNEITRPCPPGTSSRSGSCPEGATVSVATNATDPDGDTLLYNYTVSGGQITGTGANVSWDLSGAQPGTYTLSVAVDDGCGVCGTPVTREIRVIDCPDCAAPPLPDQPCPTVSVTASPTTVREGETVTFTADANLQGTSPSYNWTVTAGTIVEGQGTPRIVVTAPGATTPNITATVTLGDIPERCGAVTASATADVQVIETPRTPRLVDRFEVEPADRSKARLDQFAIELQNDPNARGFIITYGGRGARNSAAARARFAVDYLVRQRGVDRGRLVTIDGGVSPTNTPATELYIVPAGAAEPTPNPQD